MGTRMRTYGHEPNTRRQFFGVAGLALASAAVAVVTAPESLPKLRTVERFSYATDSWSRCRMCELRDRDVFKLGDCGTFRATGNPVREPNGRWAIQSDIMIDPETNQWVPITEGPPI